MINSSYKSFNLSVIMFHLQTLCLYKTFIPTCSTNVITSAIIKLHIILKNNKASSVLLPQTATWMFYDAYSVWLEMICFLQDIQQSIRNISTQGCHLSSFRLKPSFQKLSSASSQIWLQLRNLPIFMPYRFQWLDIYFKYCRFCMFKSQLNLYINYKFYWK